MFSNIEPSYQTYSWLLWVGWSLLQCIKPSGTRLLYRKMNYRISTTDTPLKAHSLSSLLSVVVQEPYYVKLAEQRSKYKEGLPDSTKGWEAAPEDVLRAISRKCTPGAIKACRLLCRRWNYYFTVTATVRIVSRHTSVAFTNLFVCTIEISWYSCHEPAVNHSMLLQGNMLLFKACCFQLHHIPFNSMLEQFDCSPPSQDRPCEKM